MDLNALREQIDKIDEKIIELIDSRVNLSKEVGKLKKNEGLLIEDRNREKIVLAKVKKIGIAHGLNANFVEKVFRLIIKNSKQIQDL